MNDITLSGLVAAASGGLTYLFTRKKENADIKVTNAQAHISELDATEKAVAIWRNLAQDLNKQVDDLRNLINELRGENEKLCIEVNELRIEIAKNRKYIEDNKHLIETKL